MNSRSVYPIPPNYSTTNPAITQPTTHSPQNPLVIAYNAINTQPSHEFYKNFYSAYSNSYNYDYYITAVQSSQKLDQLYNLQNIISNNPLLKSGTGSHLFGITIN